MPTLCHNLNPSSAEVAKLVDAADSKSAGAKHRAGSIPAFGTTNMPALFHDSAGFFFGYGATVPSNAYPFGQLTNQPKPILQHWPV